MNIITYGIINLGRISHKKVLGMFKKSILLFPSDDETFGLPLIEASIGTPIVASNKLCKRICLNAYLFDPSSKSISLNMEKCIQNLKKTMFIWKNINNGKSFINLLLNHDFFNTIFLTFINFYF